MSTRHGQVRLYDTRTGQRRPVTELTWDKDNVANTALAPVTETQQVIVGTNTGTMGLWDWRVGQGYRGLVRKYLGSVGAVRDIATQPGAQNRGLYFLSYLKFKEILIFALWVWTDSSVCGG